MNGKDKKQIEHSVTVSLEKYIDKLFEAKDEKLVLLFDELKRATDKAEQIMDRRLNSMNEFRDTLKDQAAQFMTKEAVELRIKPLCDSVRMLEDIENMAKGKASIKAVIISAAIGSIGFILSLIQLLAKK